MIERYSRLEADSEGTDQPVVVSSNIHWRLADKTVVETQAPTKVLQERQSQGAIIFQTVLCYLSEIRMGANLIGKLNSVKSIDYSCINNITHEGL